MENYKLNTRRTIFVGFAFFLISAFWQAYDTLVPLILTNHFGLRQAVSGAIMALDNVFALFMLPIFGAFSDKTSTKFGKRTPFIFLGTIAAVIAFIALSFADNYQVAQIMVTNPEAGYNIPELQEQLLALPKDAPDSARDDIKSKMAAVALAITLENPLPLICFIGILLLCLMSMATFRSPAVALMPDVTVKPLRSKANAIINLMGTAGGILVLVLGMVFGTDNVKNTYMNYTWFIVSVCAVMAFGLTMFIFLVKERKWNKEMLEAQELLDQNTPKKEETVTEEKLPKDKLISLILILASVALWYIGYNAVTSKFSVYAMNVLEKKFNSTLIIAQAAAIISYIPVGIIAGKFGRKKTILAGVAMLTAAFTSAIFITTSTPSIFMTLAFILAGIAWATINVNSFPMVVELAKGSNIGKYTGYYYTASMAAQVITPILSGQLMDKISMRALFPYAAIFVALSFVTMLFTKHGNVQELGGKSAKEIIADNFSGDD